MTISTLILGRKIVEFFLAVGCCFCVQLTGLLVFAHRIIVSDAFSTTEHYCSLTRSLWIMEIARLQCVGGYVILSFCESLICLR